MRGLAVAAVVAYHLGYLRGGFLGVDVFFVLSGYLITGLVLGEVRSTGGFSLRAFWGRRIRRLVPALLVMVAVAVALALALGWPASQRRSLAIDATATLTWWANWRQAGGASYWDSGESLFRHAWSLSIEEQFYVLWPLALVAALAVARRRGWSARACIGAAAAVGAAASAGWSVVLSHRLADADLSRVYVGTDTRVLAPLVGCLLACAVRPSATAADDTGIGTATGSRRWVVGSGLAGAVVLGLLMATVEVFDPALYRNGGFIVAAVAAVAVVRAASSAEAGHRDPVGWLTTRRTSVYLGTRSYAIYLWSWPVQVLVLFRWPEVDRRLLAAVVVVAAVVLAEVSQRVVETPLRRRTGWAAAPRLRRPAWGAAVVAAWAMVAVALAGAEPPPAHQRVDAAEAAAQALQPASTVPAREAGSPSGLRIMVTGDSVAWTAGYYKPPADQLPPGIASIDSRAIIGCGILSAEAWGYPQGGNEGPFTRPGNGACTNGPKADALGLAAKPDVVLTFPGSWEWSRAEAPSGHVVPARSTEMAEVLTRRLLARIETANAAGAQFVIVAYSCPGAEAAPVRRDPEFLRWINRVLERAVHTAIARGGDARFLEPTDAVCVDGDPAGEPTQAKRDATADEIHVADAEGGRWMWEAWLAPALTGS